MFDLLPKVDAIFGNASELRRFAEIAVSEGRLGAASLLQGEGGPEEELQRILNKTLPLCTKSTQNISHDHQLPPNLDCDTVPDLRNGVNNGHTCTATTFIITDGPNAVRHFEFSRGHRVGGHAGAVKVERVETISDTIGAGDSFVAGYLSAQLKGKGVTDSVEEGVRKMTVLKEG